MFTIRSSRWAGLVSVFAALALIAGLVPASLTVSASSAQAATGKEKEKNGSRSKANVIRSGTTYSGSASTKNDGSYSGDHDYFAIDVAKPSRLGVNFTFPNGLGGDDLYEISVENSAGKEVFDTSLDASDFDGKRLKGQGIFLPKGRHYVHVYGSSYDPSWGKTYKLTATLTSGNVETEFNGSRTTADIIASGTTYSGATSTRGDTSYSGDYDYYAIDVTKPSRLILDLTYPKGLGGDDLYTVAVENSAGKEVYEADLNASHYSGSSLRSRGIFVPAGRHYVRIYGSSYDPSWGRTYKLKATLTPGNVETEFNGSRTTADTIKHGVTYSGASSTAGDTSYSGDYDYYAIDNSRSTRVRIGFAVPAGAAGTAYDVSVENAAGRTLYGEWEVQGHQRRFAKYVTLPAGRSYVKVYGSSYDPSWGKVYKLNVSKTMAATPAPKIAGKTNLGSTVKVRTGTWKPSGVKFTYQWKRNGKAIKGATRTARRITTADLGKKITVAVRGAKATYASVTKTSATKAIPLRKLTRTPQPTIKGTSKVGKTLKVNRGTWRPSGVQTKVQWQRNGKAVRGATKTSYKVKASDRAKRISVKVTSSKSTYKSVSRTSKSRTIRR